VFYCDICYYQCHAEYIFILPDRGGSVLHLAVDGKDRFTMREDICTIFEKKTEKKLNFRNFLLMFEIQKSNILFNYSPRYSPVKPWQSAANNTIKVHLSPIVVVKIKCKSMEAEYDQFDLCSTFRLKY
jgi:hypothetical protein